MSEDNKQWFEKDSNPQKKPNPSKGKVPNGRPNSKSPNSVHPTGKNSRARHNAQVMPNGQPKKAPENLKHPSNKNVPNTNGKNQPINKNASVSSPKKDLKAVPEAKKKTKKFKLHRKEKKIEPKNVIKEEPISAINEPKKFDQEKANLDRQKRGRKTAINKALISIAASFLIVFVLIFVIHHLFDYIAAKPELTFISNGSVEHTIGAKGFIVRDEVLVPTNTTGDLVTQATEGSRVYKNQRIGMVVPENMQTVVDSLRNTQSQISDIQQELIQNGLAEGADQIYDEINNGLSPIVDLIRLDAMDGKISGMSSYTSSIAVLLNQRETTLSELDFDDERLRVLRSDETAYENQLSRNATLIRATTPGVVSFRLDGLENDLSFDYLLTADTNTMFTTINNAVDVIPADLQVEDGQNVARIASNEQQYIACFLDEQAATVDSFAVGTRHTINIGSEGISIGRCVVERVEPTNHGLYVVFSTTRYVEDLLDLRSVDIEVVINETSGLRVPISSLVSPDYNRNIASIYVNNQGFCDEVSVIIEDYDREFAIIAPIGDGSVPNLHTVIITNPSSIKPGEKVD